MPPATAAIASSSSSVTGSGQCSAVGIGFTPGQLPRYYGTPPSMRWWKLGSAAD
jgi:hypothetical protein